MSSDQLEGKIVRITFFNPSNNFTIAKIKTPSGDSETVLGILPAVNQGEYLKFHGYWKDHEKFGRQFMIESFEFFSPETLEEIENFLLTGTFEGLTKPIARKIIKKYGEESLTVLDQDIDRIFNEIKIPAENFESIKNSWNDQREFRRVLIFLQKLGIKSSMASKIYSIYGSQTQGILSNNPYVLLEDIPGLPFEFPDQMAFKLGFTEDADQRIEAGIIHFLSGRADDGHVYFPMERLLNECTKMLGAGFESVHDSLYNLNTHGKLVIEILKDQDTGDNIQSVFLTELYEAEIEISRTLRNLAAMPAAISEKVKEKTVSWLEKNLDTELAEAQKRAVSAALENRVVVITGGPGTGKTTIIKSILQLLKKLKLKSLLAAPTGRAAKRMSEATDHDASTIHRLLEFSPGEGGFTRDSSNPLEADFIIIDECSMIDTMLLQSLLRAVPPNASLVMVGDADQLPSIGAGNILKDLIAAEVLPVIKLTEIYRQSKESMIVLNAHRINRGMMPHLSDERYPDFRFYTTTDPVQTAGKIIEICTSGQLAEYGCETLNDFQVLAPMHKGDAGVSRLNAELQNALNPFAEEIKYGDKIFRAGDKVMQNRNNYQKEIYNGDIGQICFINNKKKTVSVSFDGTLVNYEYPELEELMLAYAVSVHKSQGSEYKVVVLPVVREHFRMLQRNLLYTAITRSREAVIIVGTADMLSYAVNNNRAVKRYTCLMERLKGN